MRDAVDRPAAMTWRRAGPAALAAVLFVIAAAFAMSIDVVRSTFGIKSDEATYVGAALFTTAFVGAASVPVFGVFLMPEIFNFSIVFIAYFLWLDKEVTPESRLNSRYAGLVAAALLGLATYSKPSHALLVAPLVLLAWHRRRWRWGFTVGTVAVAAAALFFSVNLALTGEFNYQGGDRKTFYTTLQSHAYLMSVRSSEGFVPHLQNPGSGDYRNLGALMRFSAVTGPAAP